MLSTREVPSRVSLPPVAPDRLWRDGTGCARSRPRLTRSSGHGIRQRRRGVSLSGNWSFSSSRMFDVPVPAATVRRPRSRAAVRAHAFARDCVCFPTDSSLPLNFYRATLGSRTALRLSLPVVGFHLISHSAHYRSHMVNRRRACLARESVAYKLLRGFAKLS